MIVFAITKKCDYGCEHCFAGEWVNKPDSLSMPDLYAIVEKFQDMGVSQVHLSGGEPLARFNDLILLLEKAKKGTEFLLLTTGMGLTTERALALKKAGLVGVVISLDHFREEEHNAFRKHDKAFSNAISGIHAAKNAGLVVSTSVCATRELLRDEHSLWMYYELAKELGVSFVRVLEPRTTGNYHNKDVQLTGEELAKIEDFHHRANLSKKYRNYPIVVFYGYHQGHVGCIGAGWYFLDVDADGNINPCPFNQVHAGNCLKEPLTDIIDRLQTQGCDCRYNLMEKITHRGLCH